MKKIPALRSLSALALILFFLSLVPLTSFGRAGGGRSFGGRGSRSGGAPMQRYSPPPSRPQPARPYNPSVNPSPVAPAPSPMSPSGGGFFRNFASGLAGGFIGSMLFRGMSGNASGYDTGSGGRGGFGFLELLILAALGFFAYRFFKNRQQTASPTGVAASVPDTLELSPDVADGPPFIDHDTILDIFFRVQSAYSNRDLSPISDLLTPEVKQFLQGDVDALITNHQIDKLDNIAVRDTNVTEQWQEAGQDWATVHITANVIDYTIDENTQAVISGSKTSSVKFEEYWTVVRPTGGGPSTWKLSAIQQK